MITALAPTSSAIIVIGLIPSAVDRAIAWSAFDFRESG
jgi:hypothetical protein